MPSCLCFPYSFDVPCLTLRKKSAPDLAAFHCSLVTVQLYHEYQPPRVPCLPLWREKSPSGVHFPLLSSQGAWLGYEKHPCWARDYLLVTATHTFSE